MAVLYGTQKNAKNFCPGQGIDTTQQNPAAQLQLNILCAVAEFEREVIRERVNAGLSAARLRGVKLGGPSTLGRHEKAVAALMGDGLGVCEIARKLGIPLSSAHKVIKRLSRQRQSASGGNDKWSYGGAAP